MLGIDMGSNTMRAVVMNEKFEKIDEYEFIIGAAKGLELSGKIGDEALDKLKNALKILAQKHDLKSATALATAAFRKANNSLEIFESLKSEFGINFKIINAKTEAKLSVLGMQTGLKKLKIFGEFGFCDLGGASCELSFKNENLSFDFGIISFFERAISSHFKQDLSSLKIKKYLRKKYPNFIINLKDKKLKLHFLLSDEKLLKMAFLAFKQVENIKKSLNKFQVKSVVLNSGVPTTILALKMGVKYENYDANLINGKKLSESEILKFALKISKMSENEAAIWVGKLRKNYLLAGCFLLFALFKKHHLIIIDDGLREGICVNEMMKNDKKIKL